VRGEVHLQTTIVDDEDEDDERASVSTLNAGSINK
jgi:hypothetical protein